MLSDRQWRMLDAVAALAFAAFGVASMIADGSDTHPALAVFLVLGGSLPVAVRRRWPRPIFGVVFLIAVISGLLGDPGFNLFAAAYALYTVASATNRPSWEPTLAIGIATGGVALLATVGGPVPGPLPGVDLANVFLGAVGFGAAWTIGRAVRARREYRDQVLRRHAEQAVAEDRLRIARDLHDVIAHSLSMITVKSGVAAHVASDQPEQAAEALRTIETTSRDTLTEVRRILGVLRSGDGPDGRAVPTLADLPSLLDETDGTAGAAPSVRLSTGDPDTGSDLSTLPFDVQLTAYRIVQEAVTNTRRHSGAANCEVRLERVGDQLRMQVIDDGVGAVEGATTGNGLRGMAERVGMYGGSLWTGNRDQSGYQVRATIPLSKVGSPS